MKKNIQRRRSSQKSPFIPEKRRFIVLVMNWKVCKKEGWALIGTQPLLLTNVRKFQFLPSTVLCRK